MPFDILSRYVFTEDEIISCISRHEFLPEAASALDSILANSFYEGCILSAAHISKLHEAVRQRASCYVSQEVSRLSKLSNGNSSTSLRFLSYKLACFAFHEGRMNETIALEEAGRQPDVDAALGVVLEAIKQSTIGSDGMPCPYRKKRGRQLYLEF